VLQSYELKKWLKAQTSSLRLTKPQISAFKWHDSVKEQRACHITYLQYENESDKKEAKHSRKKEKKECFSQVISARKAVRT